MDFWIELPIFSRNFSAMTRREILRYTAYATGAAVSGPLLTTILSGCKPEEADYPMQFFGEKDFAKVKDLIDVILPETDSPSASEVNVHKMIDAMVGTVYKKEDRIVYEKGFSVLVRYLKREAGNKEYLTLQPDEKIKILQKLDQSDDQKLENARTAYLHLKQQTIAYYLSTEEIAKKYLNYLPIPGDYESCIPLADVGGKAWAL